MIMRILLTMALLLTILTVGGCGQKQVDAEAATRDKASGSEQMGYLHSDDISAAFIRWTEVDKKVNGQLQVFYTKGNVERQSQNASYSFEGVCDRGSISINFTGSVWISDLSGKTWTGTLNSTELTLVVPTGAGTLAPVKFQAASVEDYNNAVATIRKRLVEQNVQVQRERDEQARIAAEQQAVVDANQQVESATSRLVSATDDLLAGADFDLVLRDYGNHLKEMQAHHQEMRGKAAKKQLTSSELREVESELRTVESDLRSIESDARAMDFRLRSMNVKIAEVRASTSLLQRSWGALQQAVSANTSATPGTTYTGGYVSEQVRRAEAAIENASTIMQRTTKQATTFDGQARELCRSSESFVKTLKVVGE
jgi:hypothetical protein